jgi:hypothetical protein
MSQFYKKKTKKIYRWTKQWDKENNSLSIKPKPKTKLEKHNFFIAQKLILL